MSAALGDLRSELWETEYHILYFFLPVLPIELVTEGRSQKCHPRDAMIESVSDAAWESEPPDHTY